MPAEGAMVSSYGPSGPPKTAAKPTYEPLPRARFRFVCQAYGRRRRYDDCMGYDQPAFPSRRSHRLPGYQIRHAPLMGGADKRIPRSKSILNCPTAWRESPPGALSPSKDAADET